MKRVKCPQCKILVAWSKGNEFRPFCSKRCSLLDLGAWASERNKIKGNPSAFEDNIEDFMDSKITKN